MRLDIYMKRKVRHEYSIPLLGLSGWGQVKAIEKALEPHKMLHNYGFRIADATAIIWWETDEDMGR